MKLLKGDHTKVEIPKVDGDTMGATMKDYGLLSIGVLPWMSPMFAKRIILCNFISLLFGGFICVFTLLFYSHKLFSLAAISVFWAALTFSWIYINHLGLYLFARIGLIVGTDLIGFLVCWKIGKESGFQLAYFGGICTPLILFSPSEKKLTLATVILTVFCYFILQWMPESLANSDVLPAGSLVPIRFFIDIVIISVILASVYYLRQLNDQSETQLQAAIKKLQNTNQLLEVSIHETQEAQTKLIQADKMAALGLMAGGIAHEINSPLTAMILNAEFIKMKSNASENSHSTVFKRAQAIAEIGKRIAKIINGLRHFSRDSGDDAFESFEIKKIVDSTLDLCEEKFKRHGVKIIVKDELLDTMVHGQIVPLSQVLLNLLNNSFDAVINLKNKWVQIEAVIDGQFIALSVTDSGTGIPIEIVNKIFQPFFTTKDVGKGTGLGLSISQGIVQSHGGNLFYDYKSKNTKFVMQIPYETPTPKT